MTKIAFIDDDPAVRRGLLEAVRLHPDISCLAAAESIEAFWTMMPERAQPDIVFVDIDLPGQSGIEALPALYKRFPKAELVMLTGHEDTESMLQAFHAGAGGYLVKGFPWMEIRREIELILKGGAVISPQMARRLIGHLQPSKPQSPAPNLLSSKETQLLRLFSEGSTYEEAAGVFGVSIDGIKYHVKNIYRKLNVDNRHDALRTFNAGFAG
jgi:DNA-binding NarL/FixJ family response regulator